MVATAVLAAENLQVGATAGKIEDYFDETNDNYLKCDPCDPNSTVCSTEIWVPMRLMMPGYWMAAGNPLDFASAHFNWVLGKVNANNGWIPESWDVASSRATWAKPLSWAQAQYVLSLLAYNGVNIPTLATCTSPACASNPSPANGATGVSTLTPITWASVSGATSYDVYFGTSSPPQFAINTISNSYSPGIIDPDQEYYWQVVPKNSCGGAMGCTVWSFTTKCTTAPSCAAAPSPATGATGVSLTPTLSWASTPGATSYDVYFGTTTSPPKVD